MLSSWEDGSESHGKTMPPKDAAWKVARTEALEVDFISTKYPASMLKRLCPAEKNSGQSLSRKPNSKYLSPRASAFVAETGLEPVTYGL